MKDDKTAVMVTLSELDLQNLQEIQSFYERERGLQLKRASAIKMLLADKATELRNK